MELIAITDDQHSVEVLATKIIQIIDAVDYVHIREKSKTAIELLSLLNLLKINKVDMKKIVLNDRLDIAIFSNLTNIHLPGHGLPLVDVKEYFPNLRVGKSVHTLTEAIQAENDQADYIMYGHCFETECKNGLTPNGIELIPEMKKTLTIPIYAVGGILPEHIQVLKENDIDGIAVMSGIFSARNPLEAALQYFERCKFAYEQEI
ncbi:thiamine phosphate synthase [Bacillus sp. AFS001701]|uniref:thiamine phosphate synthase n=1 Tax=Bacillaceae TaxID=186817 RepID=UPI000BF400A2|nr:thiamine phosphate synthase [Bacillus sp. AFS001701]PET44302.1 thiamine phosphate synthase [Bacillus sp. AFS001701]